LTEKGEVFLILAFKEELAQHKTPS